MILPKSGLKQKKNTKEKLSKNKGQNGNFIDFKNYSEHQEGL
jgi:hypothetical protein